MFELENKEVLVIGLGGRGRAACELLRRQGASVTAVDTANTPDLRQGANELRPLGVEVALGVSSPPKGHFSLAVLRPAVAVLMNVAPDHLDRYASASDYIRANARLFQNQQAFDWAIIQSEALARLRELNIELPAKVITFSATDPKADITLDRGLLMGNLPDWSGPLLDIDHCQVR